MKRTWILVITAAVTVGIVLAIVGLARAGSSTEPDLQSGAPTVVSYQGNVAVDNSPYEGTGYFRFAVVNAAGDTTYWSNDGTSTGARSPPLPYRCRSARACWTSCSVTPA